MKHSVYGYTTARRWMAAAPAGGVDTSLPPHRVAETRLSDALNVHYRNGALCTRPAWRERGTRPGDVPLTACVSLAHGVLLYGVQGETLSLVLLSPDGMTVGKTHRLPGVTGACAVPPGSAEEGVAVLYTDGAHGIYRVAADGELTALAPYIPTVLTAGRPTPTPVYADSGARAEEYNRLCGDCRCGYTTDGTGIYYWLPRDLAADTAQRFFVNCEVPNAGIVAHHVTERAGTVWSEKTVGADGVALRYDTRLRAFWFVDAAGKPKALPLSDTADNVFLCASRTATDTAIYGMRFGCWYGGSRAGTHLVLGGAAACPSDIVWSAAGDPTYFPLSNRATVGTPDGRLTAFGKQNGLLVLFKEREIYTAQYAAAESVSAAQLLAGAGVSEAGLSLSLLHAACGCDCPATLCLCGDRLCWLCRDGRVYALFTGGTYDCRSVRAVSAPLEAQLRRWSPAQCAAACAAYGEGRYLLYLGDRVYVLDCTASGFAHYTSYASDEAAQAATVWYIWDVPVSGRLVSSDGQVHLVARTKGGMLCTYGLEESGADRVPEENGGRLAFSERPIPIRVCTRRHELGAPSRYKQLLSLRLWVTGDEDGVLTVTLHDGDRARTVAQLRLTGEAAEAAEPRRIPLASYPVRQCGVQLEAAGHFALDSLELTYRVKGEIRHHGV